MRLLCISLLLVAWHRKPQWLLLRLNLRYPVVTREVLSVRPHLVHRQPRPHAVPTPWILLRKLPNGPTLFPLAATDSLILCRVRKVPKFEKTKVPPLRVQCRAVGILRGSLSLTVALSIWNALVTIVSVVGLRTSDKLKLLPLQIMPVVPLKIVLLKLGSPLLPVRWTTLLPQSDRKVIPKVLHRLCSFMFVAGST